MPPTTSVPQRDVRELVVVPWSGLCNRIQTLTCGRLLAEDTGRRMFLNWYWADNCAVRYDELFTLPLPSLDEIPADARIYSSINREKAGVPKALADRLDDSARRRFHGLRSDDSRAIVVASSHQFLNYFHDRRFGPKVRELFGTLRPEIASLVEEFKREHFGRETIGVHVRRTDWKGQRGTEWFVERMKAHPGATFLICSDDPATFDELREHVPSVVQFPKAALNRGSREGMIEAVVDLVLLASTSYLIGTPGSSFTAMARVIGDIPGNFRYGLSLSMRDFRLGNVGVGTILGRLTRHAD